MQTTSTVWEWRAFRSGFEDAERRIRALPIETIPRRATHLICDMSAADARVCDGMLSVRLLRHAVSPLEHWDTVIHAGFPVDELTVRRVFGYLDLRPPRTERDHYSQPQFMEEIVAPQHALSVVQVGGIHHVVSMRGCTVDAADLTINGMPGRSLLVEGEDQRALNAVLQDLGLADRASRDIVNALKEHVAHAR
jgi:hypothetical protein